MSETIPWKTLSPWQRNQLVAEKVLGVKDFRCIGKLDYRGDNTMLRHHYYFCMECGATLTVTDAMPRGWRPSVHNRFTPHYSESLDAALMLLERFDVVQFLYMNRNDQGFFQRVVVTLNHEDYEASISNTAEAICIAALRAVGCEVILD